MNFILKLSSIVLFAYFIYTATGYSDQYNLSSDDHLHINAFVERCPGSCNTKYCRINSTCRPVSRFSKLRTLDIYFHDGIKFEAPVLLEITAFKKYRTVYRQSMLRYKKDFCELAQMQSHPIFSFFGVNKTEGNMFDACPLFGHRHEMPRLTTGWVGTLVPIGEWRVDFILTKVIGGVEEKILAVSIYYLVKPKTAIGADEF